MSSLHASTDRTRAAAAIVLVALASGCARPLAVQHEFFSPTSGSADRISTQTWHTISHHRAQQIARHACGSQAVAPLPSGQTRVPDGPNADVAAANREALAALCASEGRRPAAAYGGASNAYRRWVEDQVRELPETSETAASAAGS